MFTANADRWRYRRRSTWMSYWAARNAVQRAELTVTSSARLRSTIPTVSSASMSHASTWIPLLRCQNSLCIRRMSDSVNRMPFADHLLLINSIMDRWSALVDGGVATVLLSIGGGNTGPASSLFGSERHTSKSRRRYPSDMPSQMV